MNANSRIWLSIIFSCGCAGASQAACPNNPTWKYSGNDIVNCNSGQVIVGESGGSTTAKLHLRVPYGINPLHVESANTLGVFWDRFTIESNPDERNIDINFRNSVINLGSWNSNASHAVGLNFQSNPDGDGSIIVVNKPGHGGGSPNGEERALLVDTKGTIHSYVTGLSSTALWVGRFTNSEKRPGEPAPRGAHFRIGELGPLFWGNPDAIDFEAQRDDTNLYRSSPHALTTDGSFTAKTQVSTTRVTQQVTSVGPLTISNPNANQDVVLETANGDVRVAGYFQYQVVASAPQTGCGGPSDHGRALVQTVAGGGMASTKLWICGDGGWISK